MKTKMFKLFFASTAAIAMLSGCMNQEMISDPTTQKGAAIGAVTGAVIGGNVGDGSGTNIAAGAVLGAIAGGAIADQTADPKPTQTGGWE